VSKNAPISTIEDVARRAGVSRQTVSRVMNGSKWVAAETRDRVLQAARDLQYRRNALAGSLRSGRTRIIGMLVSNILNPLYAGQVRGVQDVADLRGYQVILCNTDEDVQKERRLLETLREHQIDGLIVIPCDITASRVALADLYQASIPVVVMNRTLRGLDGVMFDGLDEIRQAVQHLIDEGYRRVALVTPPVTKLTPGRRGTYRAVLRKNGIEYDPRLIRHTGHDVQAGYAATRELMRLPRPPTAMYASTNMLTLGVLLAARDLGLRIPDDLALVGANEELWSKVTQPALTMVQVHPHDLGRVGAELLFRRLDGDAGDAPTLIRLPSQLVIGESSLAGGQAMTTTS
jgi:LacI family transcriptional regulator